MSKIKITVRVGDESERGETIQEQFFFDIVSEVQKMIVEGMNDKKLRLDELHPRTSIALVASNIIINLFFQAAHSANPHTKIDMLRSLLHEVEVLTLNGFKSAVQSYEGMTH